MSDSQSVSVPSRGEESNNSHRFLTRSKSASSSFRPLSGRRVQQSRDRHHLQRRYSILSFRPLSGQRVQQSELRTTFSGTPVMFPSPLGAKSPTIRGCSRKVQGEVMGFPSPLGVKSSTIVSEARNHDGQQHRVSVPSRGEEFNNLRVGVCGSRSRPHRFPSPLGAKSPTIRYDGLAS